MPRLLNQQSESCPAMYSTFLESYFKSNSDFFSGQYRPPKDSTRTVEIMAVTACHDVLLLPPGCTAPSLATPILPDPGIMPTLCVASLTRCPYCCSLRAMPMKGCTSPRVPTTCRGADQYAPGTCRSHSVHRPHQHDNVERFDPLSRSDEVQPVQSGKVISH